MTIPDNDVYQDDEPIAGFLTRFERTRCPDCRHPKGYHGNTGCTYATVRRFGREVPCQCRLNYEVVDISNRC